MNELVIEALAARYSLLESGGSIVHVDSDPRNNDLANLLVWGKP